MNDNDDVGIVIAILLIPALFALMGFVVGFGKTTKTLHNEAIEAGHAEYYLDAERERQWRWLPVGDGLTTTTITGGF